MAILDTSLNLPSNFQCIGCIENEVRQTGLNTFEGFIIIMYRVATLYRFAYLDDPASHRQPLLDLCLMEEIRGTLLLAEEGINGTISGPSEGIEKVIRYLRDWPGFADLEVKYSSASSSAFLRMKVRLKAEIVTMGKPEIEPSHNTGTHIDPKDWNSLISRSDVMVIDTRNDYETRIGHFHRAVDPKTATFRAFPDWADALATSPEKPKAVAMYCTGGIRCEKASAYMKQIGFEEVYHLKGGILKYLEEVPEEESLWQGKCFVFDGRVSLGHGLVEGDHSLCYACKQPLTLVERESSDFEEGVSCPYCIGETPPEQRHRFRERQKQVTLARARGEVHLGAAANIKKTR
jgi:UPF0176 protein